MSWKQEFADYAFVIGDATENKTHSSHLDYRRNSRNPKRSSSQKLFPNFWLILLSDRPTNQQTEGNT